jgi:hypothetical protein
MWASLAFGVDGGAARPAQTFPHDHKAYFARASL